jgi:DNA invertase Pin-like site-specific DNA recombinase
LADIGAGKINIVVVYKVDRLTQSLADFAKLVELFDLHGVSFVSVTQSDTMMHAAPCGTPTC